MNEDLIERFERSKYSNSRWSPEKVDIWVLPPKLNRLVSEYYQEPRKPLDAGPWLDRPELPTSDEVMDRDGGNASSSDIVDIVPNRPQGAWESKGKHIPSIFIESNLD